jgi:hypothetical protein
MIPSRCKRLPNGTGSLSKIAPIREKSMTVFPRSATLDHRPQSSSPSRSPLSEGGLALTLAA